MGLKKKPICGDDCKYYFKIKLHYIYAQYLYANYTLLLLLHLHEMYALYKFHFNKVKLIKTYLMRFISVTLQKVPHA